MRNYVLLPFLILTFVSCNKEDNLTWTERRVVGSWFYEDVDFTEKGKIGKEDITESYQGIALTFNDDFTVTSFNEQTGESYSGIWEVNVITAYNTASNTTTSQEQLIASLVNDQTGEVIQLVWDNLAVNKERMRTFYYSKEGHYNMRLEKIG